MRWLTLPGSPCVLTRGFRSSMQRVPPLRFRRAPLLTRACLALALLATAADATARPGTEARATHPNILLILIDDLGWMDVGYQGASFFETPHIDRLATQGLVFSDSYAASGNCAPSRACLMSGTYTPRHHVFAVGSTGKGPDNEMRLLPIDNQKTLSPETFTLAEALRSAGYATGLFGKWGLSGDEGTLALEQGFDVSYDSFGMGELAQGARSTGPGPPEDPKGVFTLTEHALEFMGEERDRPFFCFISHRALHEPQQARPTSLARFDAKTGEERPIEGVKRGHALMYAAQLFDLDASIGVLLASLEEKGLASDTLVILTSDNGATKRSPQEPLRGNKGCYYEGGIRGPFIARWPGVVPSGSTSRVPIVSVDLYPTLLEIAGGLPEGTSLPENLDGESLVPLFTGQGSLAREAIFWHFPGYLGHPVIRGRDEIFRTRPVSVIRKGDWKLHLYHEEWQLDGGVQSIDENEAVELFDLATDIGERQNLQAQQTAKRDELLSDLLRWIEATDAPLAVEPNPSYSPGDAAEKRGVSKRKRKR